jgi:hypothetical protein
VAQDFRQGVGELNQIHDEFGDRAALYIFVTGDARECASNFNLKPQVLNISEEVANKWGATPHRIFVLRSDTNTAWKSAPGAFRPSEARRQLSMLLTPRPHPTGRLSGASPAKTRAAQGSD